MIEDSWKSLNKHIVPLNQFMNFKIESNMFVDYIQNLTAVDLILGDFIQAYWIKYKAFPYNIVDMLNDLNGSLINVFDFWGHYYNK